VAELDALNPGCKGLIGESIQYLTDIVTRFATSGFFHKTNYPSPLIHGLKPFCIWLGICEIVDFDEYFREFEAIFENALARESGAQMGLFDEKNQRLKIS
jgi:hypothetical protein